MTPTANAFEDRVLDALLDRFDALAHQPTVVPVPIPRRAGIRRYALPVGCLAAATAASLALVEMDTPASVKHVVSPTPAYALAAWTAQPTSAAPAQISTAEDRCSTSFDQAGASQPAPGDKQAPTQTGGPWSAALVDTRADLTLALYSDGTDWMACLAGPSFVSVSTVDSTGEPAAAANTAILDKVSIREASGDLYTVALGRSGSAVTGVGLQRTDGSAVTATVGKGRFIAWWPEGQGVKALSVTTSTGTQNYPVDTRFARSGPQPTNKASGQSSGQPNNKSH